MEKSSVSGLCSACLEPPWWLGVVLAFVAYTALKWLIPLFASASGSLQPMAEATQSLAWLAVLFFLALSAYSLLQACATAVSIWCSRVARKACSCSAGAGEAT